MNVGSAEGMKRFSRAPDARRAPLGEARSMESSTKHTIATLLVCAAIVTVTATALIAMSPVP
ncbi:hypothetical protein J2X60_001987 [Curtobacterium sp. 320]|nr:hypothetical protein [Curtobacterium sp. 320]MDR6573341.1 hypothetical protein [Curtobacterium sp. 320]